MNNIISKKNIRIESRRKNTTLFYTEVYNKFLCICPGIIELNIGDIFADKEVNLYEVVYKIFDPYHMCMIYDGKLI